MREAYDGAAVAWSAGPDRVFGALAAALLATGPGWEGRRVLDIGAGSGTATRLLVAAGARVVPLDASGEMLRRIEEVVSPVVGDALALPVRSAVFDAAILGFVLNHLHHPDDALREAARVVRPGGWLLASTWDRCHTAPVREVVQQGLIGRGWRAPAWYVDLKDSTTRLTDTTETLAAAARRAGLPDAEVRQVSVPVVASPGQLVAWRLGLPHTAPFMGGLTPRERRSLVAELTAVVAEQSPLVCTLVMLRAQLS
jgi:ubiquinone/menaquinone biosynthesis C-methylase UbiE